MEEIIERCAGLDVHHAELTACARVPDARGNTVEQIRGYGTTTPDLLELLDWLRALGIAHVAMESTGVYWKPIYCVIEDDSGILLRVAPNGRMHAREILGLPPIRCCTGASFIGFLTWSRERSLTGKPYTNLVSDSVHLG